MARDLVHTGKSDAIASVVTKVPKVSTSAGSTNAGRCGLADITNLRRNLESKPLPEKANPNFPSATDKIDYSALLVENSDLLRILRMKNQIIEQSNMEIQKLRLSLSKLQSQNWQLSLANTQLLAELSMGKDKLKLLGHKLVCTEATLKVKSLELEKERLGKTSSVKEEEKQLNKCSEAMQAQPHFVAKEKPPPKRKRVLEDNPAILMKSPNKDMSKDIALSPVATCESAEEEQDCGKRRGISKSRSHASKFQHSKIEVQNLSRGLLQRKGPASSISLISENWKDQKSGKTPTTTTSCNENIEKKRSTRNYSKMDAQPPSQEMVLNEVQTVQSKSSSPCLTTSISIEDTNVQDQDPVVADNETIQHKCRFTSPCSSAPSLFQIKEQHQDVDISSGKAKARNQESQTSYIGRPSRRVTMGVSYKEVPLNVKMRRP